MGDFGPVVPPSGPCPARIMIVAEAPGEAESSRLQPLVGPSGYELRRMLAQVGVNLDECFKTNVFDRQPRGNDVGLYGVERDHPSACLDLGPLTSNPRLYLHQDFRPMVERLRGELLACNPNIVVALGNIACWALLGSTGVTELRGNVALTSITGTPIKVLPTYHPAAVLRQWDWRVIVLGDLEKARAESLDLVLTYDNTELWLRPTLSDLREFGDRYMFRCRGPVATDVETKRGQITCMSFAPTVDVSITVPFWVEGLAPNYWHTEHDERAAWAWCAQWIEDASVPKVTQNGLYDIQYFIRHGMQPRGFTEDTMLAHHSLLSEMRKSLGFLGSVYTNTPGWKKMRTALREEQLKRDD